MQALEACSSVGAGIWGKGVSDPATMDHMPQASDSHLPCLCLPRVCREHRGWPKPGVPGERAKAHPGLAGELLEAPGPVQRGPSLYLPPQTVFTQLSVTFRQIKASVFYSWAGILCSKAVPSNLYLHFHSSCHGTHLRKVSEWPHSASGETEARCDQVTTVAPLVGLSVW